MPSKTQLKDLLITKSLIQTAKSQFIEYHLQTSLYYYFTFEAACTIINNLVEILSYSYVCKGMNEKLNYARRRILVVSQLFIHTQVTV